MKAWIRRHRKTLLIIGIPFFLLFGYTAAKYIIEEFHSYYTNSKHFYFTSNILTKEESLYQINNWLGRGSFTISYNLFSKDNEYVYTDYDIPYETSVICPSDVICQIDKPTGNIYQSSHADTVTISVAPTRPYQEGETMIIELKAKSTAPYVTELKAKFEYIVGKQGVTYEIEDHNNQAYMLFKITSAYTYCTVTEAFLDYEVGDTIERDEFNRLTSEQKKKCHGQDIEISFDPNVIRLDTTSSILEDSTYTISTVGTYEFINQLRFAIDPMSTKAIKFYKQNTSVNYTYPITNPTSIINVTIQ